MPVVNDNAGRKDDAGKDPWQLAPWDAFLAIVKVLAFGAKKYEPRNWERGMDWDRVWRAAINHLTKWFMREDSGKGPGKDEETGYSHLWHAGCCIVFLIAYELRGVGKDTRPQLALNAATPQISPEEFKRQIEKYQGQVGLTGLQSPNPAVFMSDDGQLKFNV